MDNRKYYLDRSQPPVFVSVCRVFVCYGATDAPTDDRCIHQGHRQCDDSRASITSCLGHLIHLDVASRLADDFRRNWLGG